MRIIDNLEEKVMQICEEQRIEYERTEDYFVDLFGEKQEDEGMNNYEFASLVPIPWKEQDKPSVIELPDIRSNGQQSQDFQPAELLDIKKQLGFSKEIVLEGNLRKRAGVMVKGLGDQLEIFTEDVHQVGYQQGWEDFRTAVLEHLRTMSDEGCEHLNGLARARLTIKVLEKEISKMKGA